jgi:hypothetical protein
MQHFLKVFLDIVLWRRGPQDLPSSGLLLLLTLLAYVIVSGVQVALMHETGVALLLFLVLDPLLLMGTVWFVLSVFGHKERFLQTATAVLGTSALLSAVLSIPFQLMLSSQGEGPPTIATQLMALGLIVVFVLVTGRILKLALDSNLFTGIAIALTYVVVLNSLAQMARA